MTWQIVVLILGMWAGIVIIFAIAVHDKQNERDHEEYKQHLTRHHGS